MSDKENDFKLVRKFNGGDIKGFNEIVKIYQEKIYWHARRMTGNHQDADEIVQEVLLVMYNKLSDFRFQSALYTWIYRITATRSINLLRRKKLKQMFSLDDNQDIVKEDDDILKSIENKEQLKRVEKLLQKLPEKQRQTFILRTYEQLTYEEMSEITGKSIGGLKANYFHASKKLLELWNEK